jgi:hypothetical protein
VYACVPTHGEARETRESRMVRAQLEHGTGHMAEPETELETSRAKGRLVMFDLFVADRSTRA